MFQWLSSAIGGAGGWLGASMIHPLLFLGGALLVSSPIIIHLLNKRKFKTIEWAAMDFLLEAEKKNRRRVRLENLLLLLLRCLAVLLIALLLARPFFTTGLAGGLFDSARFERIVLLDDSPSMQAISSGQTAFAQAKRGIRELVRDLAGNDSDDSLTLIIASNPERPLFNSVPLSPESVSSITQELDDLFTSDYAPGLGPALLEIEKSLKSSTTNVNRVVYILTDARERDWQQSNSGSRQNELIELLRRLSPQTSGCFVVHSGEAEEGNLVVSQVVAQEKALVSGVASRFDVTVQNTGSRDASDILVKFIAATSLPLEGTIDTIGAGESASIPFTFTFAPWEDSQDENVQPEPVPIRVEISSASGTNFDRLAVDNVRYYAARLVRGVSTLIVDGDPSAGFGKAESFFLRRALAPPGNLHSGITVRIVSDVEFEGLRLEEFQVIYLCNLYHLSEERRTAVEQWVTAGGGLVFALGDQVDEELYNKDLYRDGQGLLPMRLEGIVGDQSEQQWALFDIEAANHPVLQFFQGESNPFIEGVKFFRWWANSTPQQQLDQGQVSVSARFTDPQRTPAIVEKTMGKGRILVVSSPFDSDWNNWPDNPSFLITMQQLNSFMASKMPEQGNVIVGEPLGHPLDLANYKLEATLEKPDGEKETVQAVPQSKTSGRSDETVWSVHYEDGKKSGFYRLALARNDAEQEEILFAANIDPREGDLKRVDIIDLQKRLSESKVELVSSKTFLGLATQGAKSEIWRSVLGMLVVALCGEQLLGWWFGSRR